MLVEIPGEAAKAISGLRDASAALGSAFSVTFVSDPFDPATVQDAQSRLAGFGI